MGTDPLTASQAYMYILSQIPGCFFLVQFNILAKFCNGQKYMYLPLQATLASFILHILMLQIFVSWMGLGLMGACIATTIHMFIRYIFLHVQIVRNTYLNEYYQANLWREAFSDLKGQFYFCLKATPMVALPWTAMEIFTFIVSFMATEYLAT
jgi:Na+-driven multidrug efflux pump